MYSSKQPGKPATDFWIPLRASLTLIVFALLSSFGISSCNSSSNTPATNANAPKVNMTVNGDDAPTKAGTVPTVFIPATALDTALKTMDGKPFKLAELKGKVLLIDLWATWCGPCRSEVPELVQMQSEYGPRGFEVVGLDIDPESDTPEKVRDFMKEFKINYKVAFVEREMAGSLMRGGNIPQSLVVAPDGRVIIHFTGFDRLSTPKKMRSAIEQALQAKQEPSPSGEAPK